MRQDALGELYASTQAELNTRIQARDNALIFYIVSLGALLGFLGNLHFSNTQCQPHETMFQVIVLLPLPFLSLIFTFIILQHHIAIGALSRFLREEWPMNFEPGERPVQWHTSTSFAEMNTTFQLYRTLAQGIILSVPIMYEVFLYWTRPQCFARLGDTENNVLFVSHWAGIFIGLYIALLHYKVHKVRSGEMKSVVAR